MRDVYKKSDPDYSGSITVPVGNENCYMYILKSLFRCFWIKRWILFSIGYRVVFCNLFSL